MHYFGWSTRHVSEEDELFLQKNKKAPPGLEVVNINYNSDFSGEAIVNVMNDQGQFEVKIPAAALADFSKSATIDRCISALEGL